MRHFSFPRRLAPLLALVLVGTMSTPASAFFWQKKQDAPAEVADFSKNTLAGSSITFSQEDFRSPPTFPPSPLPPSQIPRLVYSLWEASFSPRAQW